MESSSELAAHWDDAYGHGDATRSWYQTEADGSLRMFERCAVVPADSVVDVGAGASTLVDALLARGHSDVTVLDISAAGLDTARRRLGPAADRVNWLVRDLLAWRPERTYRVWHDRAVFHFLTTDEARGQYLRVLRAATAPGSVAVFATFAPDGPERCSGLPVARYSAAGLAAVLDAHWLPVADGRERHRTPFGAVQPFTWAAFRRC
ncbi:Methyltransferase domain-containing protein [Actinokineospora iranica]|uniref:Methyltransferase domain-containing protein n=1 Tax=Actinokineospora iranica TaxID=1271860 RepID=A0A1G6XSQ6_9PSEU|nr:Methyltransferase domain-containing protein [Actinokineospora iranica]